MDFDAAETEAAKQERIEGRKQRIAQRELSKARRENGEDGEADESEQVSLQTSTALQQISASIAMLDEMKFRTVGDVTDIRVLADKRERDRRAVDSDRARQRDMQLKEENLASAKANAAAVMRWADIMERQLPQELASELSSQQASCDAVLAGRDAIVKRLEAELRGRDEEYIRILAAQKDDITSLISRMKAQFEEMRDGYESSLSDIEGAFLGERAEVIGQNKKEVDSLFDARRQMEGKYIEERVEREESWAGELYDMQAADLENYARLKAKLETDVSILEQQLEHMKFTYLLNIEKLEYNFRVLSERDSENKANLASQKARLARMRQALAKVQAEYETSDARFKARNDGLTSEYQRLTRQYRELQEKFRHFEQADANMYSELARVHEEEMSAMAERLKLADRVITEQLLGYAWVPPDAAAAELASAQAAADEAARAEEAARVAAGEAVYVVDPSRLRPLLRLLTLDCSSFLIESAVQSAAADLEKARKMDEAEALRGDAILRATGATGPAAVCSLCDYFDAALLEGGAAESLSPDGDDARTGSLGVTVDGTGGGKGVPSKQYSLATTRSDGTPHTPLAFSTVATLRGWMEARMRGGAGAGTTSLNATADVLARISEAQAHLNAAGTSAGSGTVHPGAATSALASKMRAKEAVERAKWAALGSVVPDATLRTWKALEAGMAKYRGAIMKRADLVHEVRSLTAANAEVRALLAQYLSSPACTELAVNPTQTVKLGPNTAGLAAAAYGHVSAATALGVTGTQLSAVGAAMASDTGKAGHVPQQVGANSVRKGSTLPLPAQGQDNAGGAQQLAVGTAKPPLGPPAAATGPLYRRK